MEEGKIEFQKWHLSYIIDQIKMADNKINFLLAVYLSLSGITIANIQKILSTFNSLDLCCKAIFTLDLVIFVACLIYFYITFFMTIIPRAQAGRILNKGMYKSVIFWGDLAQTDINEFDNIEMKDFAEDLQKQILINSRIAAKKFANVRNAYTTLIPTIISFAVLVVFFMLGG